MTDTALWPLCRAHLPDYRVIVDTAVAWGEMDALGHVNNAVYFRYFESARIEYFNRIGYWDTMEQTGQGPILASTRCRFRAPLQYPEAISIGTRVVKLEADRFMMEYAVATQNGLVAEGDGLVVSYDYRDNCKTPLPAPTRAAIQQLEDSSTERLP